MPTTPPSGKDLFEIIIRKWHRRSDPAGSLTLPQIANMALGLGNARNASIVGSTLNQFGDYFHKPRDGGHLWKVKWLKVEQDHPALLNKVAPTTFNSPSTSATPHSFLAGMKQAIDDEISAVRHEIQRNPIKALAARDLHLSGDGSFLYEAVIELPRDAELPIPEGVKIHLRWRWKEIEATLLSYDPLNSTIIFEVERPLSKSDLQREFLVMPCVDELLVKVKSRLSSLSPQTHPLVWRVLNDKAKPSHPRTW